MEYFSPKKIHFDEIISTEKLLQLRKQSKCIRNDFRYRVSNFMDGLEENEGYFQKEEVQPWGCFPRTDDGRRGRTALCPFVHNHSLIFVSLEATRTNKTCICSSNKLTLGNKLTLYRESWFTGRGMLLSRRSCPTVLIPFQVPFCSLGRSMFVTGL